MKKPGNEVVECDELRKHKEEYQRNISDELKSETPETLSINEDNRNCEIN